MGPEKRGKLTIDSMIKQGRPNGLPCFVCEEALPGCNAGNKSTGRQKITSANNESNGDLKNDLPVISTKPSRVVASSDDK